MERLIGSPRPPTVTHFQGCHGGRPAQCSQWAPCTGGPPPNDLTWDTDRRRIRGEKRPAAVRALVLYPMNALVEDQASRLRKALDSKQARQAMDENLGGNRVYFAQFNGRITSV